jgi:D-cysteine desulfhydrase
VAELPLVRRFPGLRGLPRVSCVEIPTPVEPLRIAGVPEGALYVKRDDLSCRLYGGNKPRKLEFVLGAAAARGCRRLVTTGGLGTHHGLATAILGRAHGMRTTVVVVPQPVTEHVREQLRAMAAAGAELVLAQGVASAAAQVARVLARSALRGERPTLVPTGGSSPLGTVGFVSAALELAEQVRSGALPLPGEILVAVGSGGSAAGLVLGLALADLAVPVVGVLVTDILPPSPARLAKLARATWRRLRRADPSLPEVRPPADDFPLVRDRLGAGYGAPTEDGRIAAERARGAGLKVDEVYTAKCLSEALDRIESGRARLPLLFWHTYSALRPEAAAAGAGAAEAALPPALRALLATAPDEGAPDVLGRRP